MHYLVKKTANSQNLSLDWNTWTEAGTAELNNLMQESSDHRPRVQVRMLHDDMSIHGIFRVEDHYIRVTHLGYQENVCKDSCVEFFFKPSVGPGYFNLEMNAGASYLFFYVRNHQRTEDGFIDFSPVAKEYGQQVNVKTTLPQIVEPEITTPTTWFAQFSVPLAALEPYCGKIPGLAGQKWSCNFYKCGDATSHPHWLTWAPIPVTNFHLPEAFQTLEFE